MLKTRLKACLDFIAPYRILYDVGTDHAYLPIMALKTHTIDKAYAIDNKKGPLEGAQDHIQRHGYNKKITLIQSEGITNLPSDVDVVVIAGLGGKTIYEILNQKALRNVKRVITQPNVNSEKVRELTKDNALKIVDETLVIEDGLFYQIIVFEHGKQVLTEKELTFGPILLKTETQAMRMMLEDDAKHCEDVINQIPLKVHKKPHQSRLKMIKEVLHGWQNN